MLQDGGGFIRVERVDRVAGFERRRSAFWCALEHRAEVIFRCLTGFHGLARARSQRFLERPVALPIDLLALANDLSQQVDGQVESHFVQPKIDAVGDQRILQGAMFGLQWYQQKVS